MYRNWLCLFFALYLGIPIRAEASNLQFRYFTSYDREGRNIHSSHSIPSYPINVLKKTIFIIEDFWKNSDDDLYADLRNEYFERDNYNIYMVERVAEEELNDNLGEDLANFLTNLLEATGEKYLEFHLIGYQNGGEIASVGAKHFNGQHDFKISRVTHLNPISDQDYPSLINATDGRSVDVVHTDLIGEEKSVGSIDFFPNGGRNQPGCDDGDIICNDIRSIQLFIKSINSEAIKGIECPSWSQFIAEKCTDGVVVIFGEDVDWTATGKYYFVWDDIFVD